MNDAEGPWQYIEIEYNRGLKPLEAVLSRVQQPGDLFVCGAAEAPVIEGPVRKMAESIRTLRKRIETLERKRLVVQERPPNRTMWDLSILSDEELYLLERITKQCNGPVGPKTDLSVLSQEDRDGLILISKKFAPNCFEVGRAAASAHAPPAYVANKRSEPELFIGAGREVMRRAISEQTLLQ